MKRSPTGLGYTGIHESNWQTKGIPASKFQLTTPYRIYAKGAGASGSTPEGASDEFIIYEFDKKDTYPYVANYYGVSLSHDRGEITARRTILARKEAPSSYEIRSRIKTAPTAERLILIRLTQTTSSTPTLDGGFAATSIWSR